MTMFPLGDKRNLSYFKRFRMETGLFDAPPQPVLPDGYYWVPWDDTLLDLHAEVMYCCFHEEIDAAVFPSLGDRDGCRQLMTEIRRKHGFLPEATWLLGGPDGYCGTVQGLREKTGVGAIQNLGVTLPQRGRGLGNALLLQALHGFRRLGLGRAMLEVTAQNEAAVRLYRRSGFLRKKTVYKAVETKGELARLST
jgi:ribosomal protein S18 acetylase RimI-like enzyme